MWRATCQEPCVSNPETRTVSSLHEAHARTTVPAPPPLTRRPLPTRLQPTPEDPDSSSIAGRRASGFLQVSLSKVSRRSHRGARPATRAETPPMNDKWLPILARLFSCEGPLASRPPLAAPLRPSELRPRVGQNIGTLNERYSVLGRGSARSEIPIRRASSSWLVSVGVHRCHWIARLFTGATLACGRSVSQRMHNTVSILSPCLSLILRLLIATGSLDWRLSATHVHRTVIASDK
jgi:hypothetical protein